MAQSVATGFPPRAHLPAGIAIQSIPGLGTTWYERGWAYWIRRAGVTALSAGFLTVWTFFVGAAIRDAGPAGSPRFISMLTTEIVISLATGAWIIYRSWKHPRIWTAQDRKRSRSAGRAGASLGVLGIASPIAGAIIALLAFLSYGLFLTIFVISFAPVLPTERLARRMLAEELEQHREEQEWRRHGAHGPGKRQHKHKH